MRPQYIVIFGNPCDGYSFFGPFYDTEEAINYAESLDKSDSYFIAVLKGVQDGRG